MLGSYIFLSLLGLLLWAWTDAPRVAAGLLALVFPLFILSAPFLLDTTLLFAGAVAASGVAFLLLGRDLVERVQSE